MSPRLEIGSLGLTSSQNKVSRLLDIGRILSIHHWFDWENFCRNVYLKKNGCCKTACPLESTFSLEHDIQILQFQEIRRSLDQLLRDRPVKHHSQGLLRSTSPSCPPTLETPPKYLVLTSPTIMCLTSCFHQPSLSSKWSLSLMTSPKPKLYWSQNIFNWIQIFLTPNIVSVVKCVSRLNLKLFKGSYSEPQQNFRKQKCL